MENRKQLIVVPPMSEALKKLNEILVEIADIENIEITKIEEVKELNKMMASGQSLIIFSNAKSCALFLQENKSLIAKFHTKVILLIQKEIPAKTLVKFVKSGLSEAILEGSPPKTLLHKVKMHLRSIKAGNSKSEDKDQVVSNMLNPNRLSSAINEISSAKQKLATAQDESSAKNNSKEATRAETDDQEGSKSNSSLKADAIGTNWNSKRKTNASAFGFDNSATSFKNKREKNVYYPTKKKMDISLKSISDFINRKNKLNERKANNLPLKKAKNETSPSLNKRDRNKNELASNRDSLDSSAPSIETMDYTLGNKFTKKEFNPNEDDGENSELDQDEENASFEEIENKLNKSVDDIEIDYKNNFDKSELDPEAEERKASMPDEVAGYSIEKKSFQKKDKEEDQSQENSPNGQDYEDEIKKDKFTKKLVNEVESEEGAIDDGIPSSTAEEIENETKNKEMINEEAEENSKQTELSEENLASFDRDKKSYKIVDDNNEFSKKEKNKEAGDVYGRENKDDIFIDMSDKKQEKKSHGKETDLSDDGSNSLSLDDQESTDGNESSKNKNDDSDNSVMSFNKSNQDSLEEGKNANNNANRGKVNNLDNSLKNDDSKKSSYSWDNLVDKSKSSSFDVRKNYQPQVDLDFSYLKKNLSEQTIDYHRIKKEFDKTTPVEELEKETHSSEEAEKQTPLPEEEILKKVIEQDVRGIVFSIEIVKLIYNKDTVDIDYFKTISKELISHYNAYVVFYTYETSSSKHLETFNTFTFNNDESWEVIKNKSFFDEYFTKTMPIWQCRDIQDISKVGKFWEDIELPRWAGNEMANKKVELVFPYFDGVDLMGTAIVFFPEGINASREKSIMLTLDTARTVFLNTIQRKNNGVPDSTQERSLVDKIKKVFSFVFSFLVRTKKKGKED